MASDNSPPRIRPILATAAIAVVVLVSLKFVFDSYYLSMFEDEEFRKVGSVSPVALIALRAAEKKSLASAPIPLDRAMQLVAKGRSEPIPGMQNGGITPEQSTDEASLVGWAQLPSHHTVSVTEPASSASAAVPASSSSAAPAASGSAAAVPPPPRPAGSSAPSAAPKPPTPAPAPSASAPHP
jgi:hypothetical protein